MGRYFRNLTVYEIAWVKNQFNLLFVFFYPKDWTFYTEFGGLWTVIVCKMTNIMFFFYLVYLTYRKKNYNAGNRNWLL